MNAPRHRLGLALAGSLFLLSAHTDAGKAVVLVSSELPELLGMSDRILMLHEGRLGGEFPRAHATPERLLAAAMGHRENAA